MDGVAEDGGVHRHVIFTRLPGTEAKALMGRGEWLKKFVDKGQYK
jgi:hypothetical protein